MAPNTDGTPPATAATAAPAAQASRARGYAMLALKITVAVVALTWLARSKSLDFGALMVLVREPRLLVLAFVVWVGAVILASVRWRILLSLADAHPGMLLLFRLQLIAMFFNVVIPGNVGGDVLKAYYVARGEAPEKKPTILLLVLVDRLTGLAGLIGVAALAVALRSDVLAGNPRMRPLIPTVGLLALGAFGGPIVLALVMRVAGPTLSRLTSGTSKVRKLLGTLVTSVRLVSARPHVVLAAVVVSMGIHGAMFTLFAALTGAIEPDFVHVDYGALASVFPIGMLSLLLPISPGGVGVGHVAFAQLFELIGIDGGATVFNVFLIANIAPAMIGAIPYVLERRTLPTGAE